MRLPPPVDVPWEMKPLESAETRLERLPDGRLCCAIVHEVIRDVTPAMIVWFLKHMDDPWPGAITCEKPMRDRWGGPWPDAGASGGTAAATKLAYAPRDKALGTFLTQGLPDFRAEVRSVIEPDAGTTTPELAASTSAADAEAGEAGTEPATKAPSRCGCDLPGAPAGSAPALAASLAALVALVRSRARRTTEE